MRCGLALIVSLWVSVIGLGAWTMARYQSTSGPAQPAPEAWPRESAIPFDPHRFTVVIFLHPMCSCSNATLAELERLVNWGQGRMQAVAVFAMPALQNRADWKNAKLVRSAAAIKGVRVVADIGGIESSRFGALTSGFAAAYAPSGELRFSGGITGARAQQGDNLGWHRLQDAIAGNSLRQTRFSVFGCAFEDLLVAQKNWRSEN